MFYNQFEFNGGSRAALMFHCGLLLKEVLVVPNVGSSWEAVVSAGEAEGGTSTCLPLSLMGCPAEMFSLRPSLELMPIHLVNLFGFIKLFI